MGEEFNTQVVKKRESSQNTLADLIRDTETKLLGLVAGERSERLDIEDKLLEAATTKLIPA
jgi:hypothetical protein